MNFMLKHFLMDAVSGGAEGGDGGVGGGAAAAATTSASDAAATSATATSLSAAATATADNPYEFVPEKFRVNKEDGAFDSDASFRKLADSYTNLEKFKGEPAPKTADEYKVAVPDQFKEAWQADDPQFKDFAAKAHELGLNQAQFGFFMDKFFEIVPAVASEGSALTVESCDAALSKVWATPQEMQAGKQAALSAVEHLARGYGLNTSEIEAQLGNSPVFIQMMAKLAPEFREDSNVTGGMMNSQEDVGALMRSPAYKDEKHPDHGKVQAKVRAHYDRKHGSQQVY